MSARAPFIPRPSSRMDSALPDKPQPESTSTPTASYEPFTPTGLLGHQRASDDQPTNMLNNSDTSSAKFKPLNLSGLGKRKNDPQAVPGARPTRPHSSLDGSRLPPPSPKIFSFSGQQKRLASPRPASPFFPTNSGLVSLNVFRTPLPPMPTCQPTEDDSFSSNKAHIATHAESHGSAYTREVPAESLSAPPSDPFPLLDASLVTLRSRTASHPSLASIHELDEEDGTNSPRKAQSLAPSSAADLGNYSDEYHGHYLEPSHRDGHFPQGIRRSFKRLERAVEDDSDELEYGVEAKRYKMASQQNNRATPFDGRATPAHFHTGEFHQTAASPREGHVLSAPGPQKVNGDESKQALYRLLGQDLDICVEAHADVYEQARKKWSQCSMEDWTKGADDIAARFGKMLDFVKDHMTAKLALYATLHHSISEHRAVLSEREQTLKEARESLVREGGAVVGGLPAAQENEV